MVLSKPRVFYGWWIVVASCILWLYSSAYVFTFGMFLDVFADEYGWGMATLSGAYSTGAVCRAILGPLIGYLVDTFGPRMIVLTGVVVAGSSFLLVQYITSIWMFYLIFGFLLSMSSGPIFIGCLASVTNWFERRRSFAISLLTTAWVGGGAIIAPTAAWLIHQYGWQLTANVIGVMYLATGIPLSFIIRHKPKPYGYLPDGDSLTSQPGLQLIPDEGLSESPNQTIPKTDFNLRQAIKTKAFWMLGLAGVGFSMSVSAVTAHQIPLLTHRGFNIQSAANALGLMALFSALGRPVMGYLGDHYNKRFLLTALIAMMAAGILALGFGQATSSIYLYAVLYGVGFAVFPLTIAIVADYFGQRFFATIQQTILAMGTIGFAAGPFFVGLYFDATQTYEGAFVILAIACLVTSLLYLFNRKPILPTDKLM